MTTPEEIEVGRRNLLAQLKQALRRADLEEYPVDVATMRDLIEVLEGLAPVESQPSERASTDRNRSWRPARLEEY